MNQHLRFATISKYPPYRSGHAKQALWNNTALAVLTGVEQHQVTYCGVSSDPEDDAGEGVQVHHVKEVRGNRRVPDGHLLRAVAAELYRVALKTTSMSSTPITSIRTRRSPIEWPMRSRLSVAGQ
jgi:hypothetical protein